MNERGNENEGMNAHHGWCVVYVWLGSWVELGWIGWWRCLVE